MSLRKRSIGRELVALTMSLLVIAGALYGPASVMAQVLPGSPFGGGGSSASAPFSDATAIVKNASDATKLYKVDASGITTAETVTMTLSGTGAAPTWTATGWTINGGSGTAAAPAFAFAADADGTGTGIYRSAANSLTVSADGTANLVVANSFTRWLGTALIGWSSAAPTGALDTILSREAAAILQIGQDVNGAAVAQTLKSHDGITGTDIAGANLTIAGGRGTGTGAGGNISLQGSTALGTGTTAQTLADRAVVVSKAKTLADNSATAFLRINIASDTSAIIHVFYQVDAENATDQQTIGGMAVVPIVNDAGAETCGTIVEAGEANHVSTGTITSLITCTGAGTGTIDLSLTSDSSLNVSPLLTYTVLAASSAGVTVTPQ